MPSGGVGASGRAGFGFDAERVVFAAVLHRLMVSGSDRSCAHWMTDYAIPGAEGLALHHFYRAMAWLGEEIEPAADGDLAPRCEKDLIEEALFARRRDLFSELGLVFMDTTSLSFEGARGERRDAGGARLLEGPAAGPEADDPGGGHRRRGAAGVHGDAGGQHVRQHGAGAGRGSAAPALRHRPCVRGGGPGHDLGGGA